MQRKIIITITLIFVIGIGIFFYNLLNVKITKESVISDFNQNKEHFTIVKDYLMTQSEDYYINLNSYKEDIDDENVKNSVDHLVNMGYSKMYNIPVSNSTESMYIAFIRKGNDKDEFGVIFAQHKSNNYGLVMDLIGNDWYYHWMGFDS